MRKHVDANLLQEILNYLATCPYHQVHKLIGGMMQDAKDYEAPPAVAAPEVSDGK